MASVQVKTDKEGLTKRVSVSHTTITTVAVISDDGG